MPPGLLYKTREYSWCLLTISSEFVNHKNIGTLVLVKMCFNFSSEAERLLAGLLMFGEIDPHGSSKSVFVYKCVLIEVCSYKSVVL